VDPQDALRAQLAHVYWIGGGSGAGKSTIARHLAARYGLRLYATDDVMADHARRSTARDSPFLSAFAAMDMDERWVNRSPETMLETFHWFRGEGFGLIVEDLLGLPSEPRVIAEGFRLLPRLVRPRRADQRPRPGLAQPAAARRDVHGAAPRGSGAPRAWGHRGRHRDGAGCSRPAGGGGARAPGASVSQRRAHRGRVAGTGARTNRATGMAAAARTRTPHAMATSNPCTVPATALAPG
jgi:hypothetical protein